MGRFKEIDSAVYNANSNAFASDGVGNFEQPMFTGLIDIIRGLGFSYEFEESNIAEQDSGVSQAEEYNADQLHLFGA